MFIKSLIVTPLIYKLSWDSVIVSIYNVHCLLIHFVQAASSILCTHKLFVCTIKHDWIWMSGLMQKKLCYYSTKNLCLLSCFEGRKKQLLPSFPTVFNTSICKSWSCFMFKCNTILILNTLSHKWVPSWYKYEIKWNIKLSRFHNLVQFFTLSFK